jgi:hypothetical protein
MMVTMATAQPALTRNAPRNIVRALSPKTQYTGAKT